MPQGTVKWFNNAKGYGFLLSDDGEGDDIFAHYSAIEMEGYKTLKAGQSVIFDLIEGTKGIHAANIRSNESTANDSDSRPACSKEAPVSAVDSFNH
ncbi:MAG: cold shock domain-containing protein [Porticoccaceae bacterium]|nr:cold shock domain-containing protein [Porticoccaceae bacterium]